MTIRAIEKQEDSATVAEILRHNWRSLTVSECRLADYLLDNYPLSGLVSITRLAKNANVSTPTVVRLIQKIGLGGYAQFQARLHQELEETISTPVAKHAQWAEHLTHDTLSNGHVLRRFSEALTTNLTKTMDRLDQDAFDSVSNLLQNQRKTIFFVGSRITAALAEYFFTHMQMIRPKTHLISAGRASWPHYLLDMREGDILIAFDIRRYSHDTQTLTQLFAKNGGVVVLFTDRWTSPIAKYAAHVFSIETQVPSAWDSCSGILFVIEALLESVSNGIWGSTEARITKLDTYLHHSKLFQNPS